MKKLKVLGVLLVLVMLVSAAGSTYGNVLARPAGGPGTAPGLGNAGAYSVLGKAGVTNTGSTTLSGLVGADSSIDVGITSAGEMLAPAVNPGEVDAQAAYTNLWGQAGSATPAGPNLSGVTLGPGVYDVGSTLLPGILTLDGPGVYIFLSTSDLTSSGSVSLINGARSCDVFWAVATSASITGGSFLGTIIANSSITLGNSVYLDGRALALTGSVTLDTNTINGPSCPAPVAPVAPAAPPAPVVDDSPAATATTRAGIPSTGGAPLRGEGSIWFILGFSALSVAILYFITRKFNRNIDMK